MLKDFKTRLKQTVREIEQKKRTHASKRKGMYMTEIPKSDVEILSRNFPINEDYMLCFNVLKININGFRT